MSFMGSNPTPALDFRLTSSLFQLKKTDLKHSRRGLKFKHKFTSKILGTHKQKMSCALESMKEQKGLYESNILLLDKEAMTN